MRRPKALNMILIGAAGALFTEGEEMAVVRDFFMTDIASKKGGGKTRGARYIRRGVSPWVEFYLGA